MLIDIYIHCFNFYHSLDYDQSMVETSSFTVDFCRKNITEILAYMIKLCATIHNLFTKNLLGRLPCKSRPWNGKGKVSFIS